MLKMMKMDFNTRVGSFCVDTAEEIAKLPTLNSPGQDNLNTVYCAGMGSDCLVIGEESVYILNGNNEWVKFGSGGGSSGNVLDFLPHPEGIFAYWDFENGVENTTWTDILNGNILTCNEGASFSVASETIQILGESNNTSNSAANLNISDDEFIVIYIVRNMEDITNDLHFFQSTNPSIQTITNVAVGFSTQTIIINYYRKTFRLYLSDLTSKAMAISKSSDTLYALVKDNVDSTTTEYPFASSFGLAYQCPIKALLLSTETNNVDNIQANLKALEEKYYPA